ncbi:MAG: hypothetical protein H6702_05390 [Myxococcales bacterium]|nr:hypothetical protein [Myxococcales bacterium]
MHRPIVETPRDLWVRRFFWSTFALTMVGLSALSFTNTLFGFQTLVDTMPTVMIGAAFAVQLLYAGVLFVFMDNRAKAVAWAIPALLGLSVSGATVKIYHDQVATELRAERTNAARRTAARIEHDNQAAFLGWRGSLQAEAGRWRATLAQAVEEGAAQVATHERNAEMEAQGGPGIPSGCGKRCWAHRAQSDSARARLTEARDTLSDFDAGVQVLGQTGDSVAAVAAFAKLQTLAGSVVVPPEAPALRPLDAGVVADGPIKASELMAWLRAHPRDPAGLIAVGVALFLDLLILIATLQLRAFKAPQPIDPGETLAVAAPGATQRLSRSAQRALLRRPPGLSGAERRQLHAALQAQDRATLDATLSLLQALDEGRPAPQASLTNPVFCLLTTLELLRMTPTRALEATVSLSELALLVHRALAGLGPDFMPGLTEPFRLVDLDDGWPDEAGG